MPNPENLKPPFPKGVSGNPAGKKRGTKNRGTALKKLFKIKTTFGHPVNEGETIDGNVEDKMAVALIARALAGDVNAFREAMDSVYGKVPQALEHTGENGGPMEHTVRGQWVIEDYTGGNYAPDIDE